MNNRASTHLGLGRLLLLIIFFLPLIGYLLWKIPEWYYADWAAASDLRTGDFLKLQNDLRVALIQAIGGAALLIGLFFTWRNLKLTQETTERNNEASQRNLEIAQQSLRISQASQITERFSKAVESLDNNSLRIRLGGIYTLERIAYDYEQYYDAIMELLTAFVRENRPLQTAASAPHTSPTTLYGTDIQAILTVLGRRNTELGNSKGSARFGAGSYELNLSQTNLREAFLVAADLERANFQGANLDRALLREARLTYAKFHDASLKQADLAGAYIESTSFFNADLEGAHLVSVKGSSAKFQGANLKYATMGAATLNEAYFSAGHLENASLNRAQLNEAGFDSCFMRGADLIGARLYKANFQSAHLEQANFTRTRLVRADFSKACLNGANMYFANMENAILKEADLTGVSLLEANLDGVDLTTSLGITQKQLQEAFINDATRLPPQLEDVRTEIIEWKLNLPGYHPVKPDW